jgi:mono/diheme cytochrome c family protein
MLKSNGKSETPEPSNNQMQKAFRSTKTHEIARRTVSCFVRAVSWIVNTSKTSLKYKKLGISIAEAGPIPPSPHLPVSRIAFCLLLTAHCLLFAVACRQDMQDQPRMKPFRSTTFFRDGISSRPPVAGTVPRGFLRADREYFTGKKSGSQAAAATGQPAATPLTPSAAGAASPQGAAAYPDDVEVFPLPITEEIVKRGKARYEIFCSACHGLTGYGDGMIVRRGFRRAASFHSDNLRQAPVGHYFDAITNGWGAMPSYAAQIPVQDRWAIVAYIRALQLSQQNTQREAATSQPPAGQTQPSASPAASRAAGGHNQR